MKVCNMRYTAYIFIFITLFTQSVFAQNPQNEQKKRPLVLVFELLPGENTQKDIALASSVAVRKYLRNTEKVDVMSFDRESPTVQLAIIQKTLADSDIASYATREERLKVGKVMLFPYTCGGDVTVENDTVKINIWIGNTDTLSVHEGNGSATVSGSGINSISNGIQSAASLAVIAAADKALATLERIPINDDLTANNSDIIKLAADNTALVSELVAKGDDTFQTDNLALAIDYYQQAVNKAPSNTEVRLKLASAFIKKGFIKEGEDEINRARALGADEKACGEVRNLLSTNPEIQVDDSVKAATSVSYPSDSLISVGDAFWNDNKPDMAIASYKSAAKKYPSDYKAYEKLAFIYSSLGRFRESTEALTCLSKAQPYPAEDVVLGRYKVFALTFDKHFETAMKRYNNEYLLYTQGSATRESYYNSLKALSAKLIDMTAFSDSLYVPLKLTMQNMKRGMASSSLAQAILSVLLYLETADPIQLENADLFANQAYNTYVSK